MKMFPAIAAAAMSLTPVAAQAEDAQIRVFEHTGARYVYTVTRTGSGETLKGWEDSSNTPFKLNIGRIRVTGTFGDTTVSFWRKTVKPRQGTVEVAAR